MTYYAIKHKKYGLLGISVTPNENLEFCNSYSAEFTPDNENPWLTKSREHAISLLENRMPWYNSGIDCPENPYKKEALEIIEVEIKL